MDPKHSIVVAKENAEKRSEHDARTCRYRFEPWHSAARPNFEAPPHVQKLGTAT